MSELKRWMEFAERVGATKRSFYPLIESSYGEKHRGYHNLSHITNCLDELKKARDLPEDLNAVEMALWFHDLVYDPTRTDNEERSADIAYNVSKEMGLLGEFGSKVSDLILVTKHSGVSQGVDAQVVVDIDLSILGKPKKEFDAYEKGVRKEYSRVPQAQFNTVRAGILQGMLDRERIYSTDFFHGKYEAKARANLKRSVSALQ